MAPDIPFDGDRGGAWRYDTDRPLGPRGGFGRVFEGTSRAGDVAVAVKVIDLSQGTSERLLVREKEIADRLQGVIAEHLIRVLDTAIAEGKLLLVMDRAERSLAQHFAGGKLAEGEALSIFRDVAVGLRELQQASVIHRDLKPGNILLHEGKWKLGDFGIARDAELGTQTPTFIGAGSWAYMAPETWLGQSPSFKTDLYSLGCVGYELLVGSRPFDGPSQEEYEHQHLEEAPPDPGVTDPVLKRLVLRLLMKAPAERPQDARAVEEVLARIADRGERPSGRLAELALEHTRERLREDVEQSAVEGQKARRQQLVRQAAQDMQDMLEEAADRIGREVPEATFTWNGNVARISNPDATLELHLHSDFPSGAGDTMIGLGLVIGRNRRSDDGVPLANVVYEAGGEGRYGWVEYRFQRQGIVSNYPFGPGDRDHGLGFGDFVDQRPDMLRKTSTIWVLKVRELTVDTLEDLFEEALQLPA